MNLSRAAGILVHISSLPSKYGIGSLGRESMELIDFLSGAGQRYWQMLPISPTGYGDSPYQSFSVFAGNPYFISVDMLVESGLLTADTARELESSSKFVDYAGLYQNVYPVLRKAFQKFDRRDELEEFSCKNPWISDYALFMALKQHYGGKPWLEWDRELKFREAGALASAEAELCEDIRFYKFLQYEFFKQWEKLAAYAHSKGVQLIGDMPIYTSLDSCDVWTNPELFLLDSSRQPSFVAGFPPDAFSEVGQLWGNPLYDWQRHEDEGFAWWVSRLSHMKNLFDLIRIDHFIGFSRYYAIPYGEGDARAGEWRKGIGYKLFEKIEQELGSGWIIAEDLGIITDDVRELLQRTGFYGMKVLQFAFDDDGRSEYLPQNYKSTGCVVYTSTHDTDTVRGFAESAPKHTRRFMCEYLSECDCEKLPKKFIELAWKSTADIAITTIQDLNARDSKSRMNRPSTAFGNWIYRADTADFSEENMHWLRRQTELCARV